jgi:hypothetical protein
MDIRVGFGIEGGRTEVVDFRTWGEG